MAGPCLARDGAGPGCVLRSGGRVRQRPAPLIYSLAVTPSSCRRTRQSPPVVVICLALLVFCLIERQVRRASTATRRCPGCIPAARWSAPSAARSSTTSPATASSWSHHRPNPHHRDQPRRPDPSPRPPRSGTKTSALARNLIGLPPKCVAGITQRWAVFALPSHSVTATPFPPCAGWGRNCSADCGSQLVGALMEDVEEELPPRRHRAREATGCGYTS